MRRSVAQVAFLAGMSFRAGVKTAWRLSTFAVTVRGFLLLTALLSMALTMPAQAGGFKWFFRHVHPTGDCQSGREVAVSYYWTGTHTASGESFNPHALTAAYRTLPFGTRVPLTNPRNGRSITVRSNDCGPYGAVSAMGFASLDPFYGQRQLVLHPTKPRNTAIARLSRSTSFSSRRPMR